MRTVQTILATLVLLFPFIAKGTDGDFVTSSTWGSFKMNVYKLCDAKAGNTSCTEFNFNAKGGVPDWFIASIDATPGAGCSPTVTVNGSTVSAGTKHWIAILDATNTAQRVEGPRRPFLQTDITNAATCTGTVVHLINFYRR